MSSCAHHTCTNKDGCLITRQPSLLRPLLYMWPLVDWEVTCDSIDSLQGIDSCDYRGLKSPKTCRAIANWVPKTSAGVLQGWVQSLITHGRVLPWRLTDVRSRRPCCSDPGSKAGKYSVPVRRQNGFYLIGDKSCQSLFNSGFQWLDEADIWDSNMHLSAY